MEGGEEEEGAREESEEDEEVIVFRPGKKSGLKAKKSFSSLNHDFEDDV